MLYTRNSYKIILNVNSNWKQRLKIYMVYLYNGILLSNKKVKTTIWMNLKNIPETKDYILCDSIFIKYTEKANL